MSGIDLDVAGNVADREEAGRIVHVNDENGEPAFIENGEGKLPVTITIRGTYSATYRRTLDGQTQRALKRRMANLTPEQIGKNRVELVAACIVDWQGFTNRGAPFPYTKDNATKLLERAEWIRSQLEEAQQDHEGFSKTASGN